MLIQFGNLSPILDSAPSNPTAISSKWEQGSSSQHQRNPLLSTHNIIYNPRWSPLSLSLRKARVSQVSVNPEVDGALDHRLPWARSPRESQSPPPNSPLPCHSLLLGESTNCIPLPFLWTNVAATSEFVRLEFLRLDYPDHSLSRCLLPNREFSMS